MEWGTSFGDVSDNDIANGVVTDDYNAYITGTYEGNVTLGPFTLINTLSSIFVAYIDIGGNWVWATSIQQGSSDVSTSTTIQRDPFGSMYITGMISSSGTFTFGNYTIVTDPGNSYIYMAKIDWLGVWQWTNIIGTYTGSSEPIPRSIDVNDLNHHIYLGITFSGQVELYSESTIHVSNGNGDILVAEFDSSGKRLWSKSTGSTGDDFLFDIACFCSKFYVVGRHSGTITFGNITVNHQSSTDGFIASIDEHSCMPVVLSQSGNVNSIVTYSFNSGSIYNLFNGLIPNMNYYYDKNTKSLTTARTELFIGHSLSSTSMLFKPDWYRLPVVLIPRWRYYSSR